jgi:hypothetical protein
MVLASVIVQSSRGSKRGADAVNWVIMEMLLRAERISMGSIRLPGGIAWFRHRYNGRPGYEAWSDARSSAEGVQLRDGDGQPVQGCRIPPRQAHSFVPSSSLNRLEMEGC